MSKRYSSAIRLAIIGLVLIAIALAAAVTIPKILTPPSNLHLGDGIFKAELAKTSPERSQGLLGRSSIDKNKAMLLAFPSSDRWKITIKDMQFPVDIVWLDQFKKVVYIVKDASTETSSTDTFRPKSNAKYVVELAAGTVDSKSINIGRIAIFEVDEQEIE